MSLLPTGTGCQRIEVRMKGREEKGIQEERKGPGDIILDALRCGLLSEPIGRLDMGGLHSNAVSPELPALHRDSHCSKNRQFQALGGDDPSRQYAARHHLAD